METKCRLCKGWFDSSVRFGEPHIRCLCPYIVKNVTLNTNGCSFFSVGDYIVCNKTKQKVKYTDCLKRVYSEECDVCSDGMCVRYYRFLYRRFDDFNLNMQFMEDIMAEFVDGRDKIINATKMLNETGLIIEKKSFEKINTVIGKELIEVTIEFLEYVEQIPIEKENEIPQYVVDVYNDIVTNKIIFCGEYIDNYKMIVKDGDYAFRRRSIKID